MKPFLLDGLEGGIENDRLFVLLDRVSAFSHGTYQNKN
jgi:hypothetical protein